MKGELEGELFWKSFKGRGLGLGSRSGESSKEFEGRRLGLVAGEKALKGGLEGESLDGEP